MKKVFLLSLVALSMSLATSCQKDDNTQTKEQEPTKKEQGNTSDNGSNPDQGNSNSGGNSNGGNSDGGNTGDNSGNNEGNNGNTNGNDTGNTNTDPNQDKMFVYKAYLEYFTATWCPKCPGVAESIDRMKKSPVLKEKFVDVAIHDRDVMQVSELDQTQNFLRTLHDSISFKGGIPWYRMNRNQWQYASNSQNHLGYVLKKKPHSPIGIKISSELNQTGGKVSVSFKFRENMSNLKYNVFIVEDGYWAYQSGAGNKEHKSVLREIYGEVAGNELGSVTKGQEVSKTDLEVQYQLLTGNVKNVRVVVFVSDSQTKAVLNVQEAAANQKKEYEYVP